MVFLAWYLLWKFVLIRFGVIRALFQLNNNDQQPVQQTPSRQQSYRRQQIRRE
jgi:hypothetical protein